jgi:transcriptional regulator of acetoin/glycerol metabolism
MGIRAAWERFQHGDGDAEAMTSDVRHEILTSWRRSRLSGVDPSGFAPPHAAVDTDSRFARAARPVLEASVKRMNGTGTWLAVTDRAGLVLGSWATDPQLRRGLDTANVHPGFCFDEQLTGTNGLGTALEVGHLVTVRGEEHYKEAFHAFACVASPILHPFTQRVVGAVTIACRTDEMHPVLTTALLTMVRDVQEALLAAAGDRERTLFDAFLAEPARRVAPVITLGANVLITNDEAARLPIDHVHLWSQVLDKTTGGDCIAIPELNGRTARVQLITHGRRVNGAVLVLDPQPTSPVLVDIAPISGPPDQIPDVLVRTLRRALPAIVRGESGAGKRTAARAAFARLGYEEPAMFDVAEIPECGLPTWSRRLRTALSGRRPMIVAHIDQLSSAQAATLGALLESATAPALLIMSWDADSAAAPGHLAGLFAGLGAVIVELRPLRRRIAELHILVHTMVDPAHRPDDEAFKVLRNYSWPGNVAELRTVLKTAAQDANGPIRVEHLPTYLRASRRLTRLERAEATVIAEVLVATAGNKTEAARQLGISRPTLYAKIRRYRL